MVDLVHVRVRRRNSGMYRAGLLVALILAAVPGWAETMVSSKLEVKVVGGGTFDSYAGACGQYGGEPQYNGCWNWYPDQPGYGYFSAYYAVSYVCPAGFQRIGDAEQSGEFGRRYALCQPDPKCPESGASFSGSGKYKFSGSGTFCSPDGCTVMFSGTWPTGKDAQGGLYGTGSLQYVGGGNKGECTGASAPSQLPDSTPTDSTSPPCKAGEGVLTSSSGKVACVPPGTPGSSPPKVGTKTSVEEFPDGSKRTTETTTTCTGDACSSTTKVTNTPGQSSGGGSGTGTGTDPGTAPQSGPPGTTTKTTDTTAANGGSADKQAEGCDPSKDFCGAPDVGELYSKKAETFQGPLERFATGVRTSMVATGATNFFNVTIPSGSCPRWAGSFGVMGGTIAVDMTPIFCSDTAQRVMQIIGSVLMVVAAFAAFRWAIL